tara:strand:- start:25783 stop:26718 length:936 start_codon:yes stop_codon:yes gene_type:complete
MSIGVGLLVSFISISLLANNRIHFSTGRTYPPSVTLETSLPTPAKVQQYGECHILAAVTAAEAACFRHTRKKFSLSSAFQFYRHIRAQLENPNSRSFLTRFNDGQFSQNDAGIFETTLERIQNDNVMLESEYTMTQFNQAATTALKIRNQYWDLYFSKNNPNQFEFENKMRKQLTADLDESVKSVNPLVISKDETGWTQIVSKIARHPLQACEFPKLNIMHFKVTPERAVALINNGIPFICQTKLGGTRGQHVVLYAGYKLSPSHHENLTFNVRDSRLSRLVDTGWAPYCVRAVVVFNPEERNTVLKSINL